MVLFLLHYLQSDLGGHFCGVFSSISGKFQFRKIDEIGTLHFQSFQSRKQFYNETNEPNFPFGI